MADAQMADARMADARMAEARLSAVTRAAATMRLAWLALAALGPVGTAGCGPVGYLQQVQGRARQAVAEAGQAGAERAAPYEYTAAVEYLKKAEEEGAHAEYRVSIELGRRSEDFAKRALALARQAGPPPAGGRGGRAGEGPDRPASRPEARRGER